jgi:hypothetical protein
MVQNRPDEMPRKPKTTREDYARQPKHCAHCGAMLSFEQRFNQYCSQSCAARVRNVGVARHFKHSDVCSCGGKKRRHNTYCDACIEKRVYNTPSDFSVLKDHVARKRFLIRERGHKCEDCGLDSWKDQQIPLEMHHVDGNADNNGKENLRLLCPNCHAFTPHYKGAIKGKNSSRQIRRRKRYNDGESW